MAGVEVGSSIMISFAWGGFLIFLGVVAGIIILIGLLQKNIALRSIGLVILGITAFATPLAFYINELGNSWEPKSSDFLILAILAFLGGVSTAVGALTFRKKS
jgi:hypothetical protein